MNCLSVLILFLLLTACKVKDKPNQSEPVRSDPTPVHPSRINPDECLLRAVVLKSDTLNGSYHYLLEVRDILKKGFGFSQNLREKDQIEAVSTLKLSDSTIVTLTIQYIFSMKNGYYHINYKTEQ